MSNTMPARLLVIDQDTRYGEWLKHHLGVICPESPIGLMQLSDFSRWSEEISGRDCDVLMLAASFGVSPEDPQAQGLELLRRLRDKAHFPAVIAVAEEGNELTAVRALQLGAVDYLPKRLLTAERLKNSVKLALRMMEKRVARRLAALVHTGETEIKVVVDSRPTSVDVRSRTGTRAALAARAASVAAAADIAEDDENYSTDTEQDIQQDVPTLAAREPEKAGAPTNGADHDHKGHNGVDRGTAELGGEDPGVNEPTGADSARADADSDGSGREAASDGPQGNGHDGSQSRAIQQADKRDDQPAEQPSSAEAPPMPVELKRANKVQPRPSSPPKQVTGTAAPIPPARAPGGEFMPADFIPGYTIHATIGESEKAAVYVATSEAREENVALKVSKTLRDEVAGRQFLEREYTAIAAIRHPSIVQIHDYGVHSGYEYLVMEYLPRGDLKARMQQTMTEREAVRCVSQIAAALQVVHLAGLVHRDLKPPNVMLRENGDVALIDFGLARALDGSTPSTRTGVLRGSPYYMSPEQALGEVLDARSDFYSLGIMYYEMLTGKKPYTGGSAMDVLQQHVNAPVPMLPKPLAHHEPVLLKLMAKSREDRFTNAAQLLAALGSQIEPLPVLLAQDNVRRESTAA
jgi:DNA-binding response OmpR family regulator